MAKVKFSRTETSENISTIPIVDGQLVYTKDGKAFLDYGEERIEIVSGGDTTPIGAISAFAEVDETSPLMSDWVMCDGRELSRSEYSALYSVIGTKYGAGDGTSTFNVPNINGKMIVGIDVDDEDFNEVGKTGGSKTHTQTVDELAKHNHIISSSTGVGNPIIVYADGQSTPGPGATNYTLKYDGTTSDSTPYMYTKSNGNGSPMDIMNPYIVGKYYIKAFRSASSTAEVKNNYTESDIDTYSCNYVNNMQANIITNGSPVKTGRKVDGKDEYIKRIGIAQLPNASALEVDTGLNINEIVVTGIECLAYRSSDKTYIPVPFISMVNSNIGLNTKVNSNILYLLIETTIDRSNFSGWAEIRFVYE